MISRFAGAIALTTLSVSAFSQSSGDELLVLRNGYVISGQVSRVGDRYLVRVAEGSETRIPLSAVEFRCRNIEDAYFQKTRRIGQGQVNDRLELIQWCLHHKLLQQAREQLAAAEQLDPLNPRLHQLRRRFDSLTESIDVAASVPVSTYRMKADELDLLMSRLPNEAVEQFTTTVQPLLVNRCSNGGCHGPNSESAFQLIRPRPGRELARPFTQRNLHATLQAIERDNPLRSSLAKVLSKPHGPNGSVSTTLSKGQADLIVNWIKSVSKKGLAKRPITISATSRTLRQTSSSAKHRPPFVEKSNSPELGKPGTASGTAPPDPFDPEEFNHRYHSKPKNEFAVPNHAADAPVQTSPPPRTRSSQAPPAFNSPIPRR